MSSEERKSFCCCLRVTVVVDLVAVDAESFPSKELYEDAVTAVIKKLEKKHNHEGWKMTAYSVGGEWENP